MHLKREADGTKGFATVSASGNIFAEAHTLYGENQLRIKAAFKDASDAISQTLTYLKQKTEEIKDSGRIGPLADIRVEFTKMRANVSKTSGAHSQLERLVAESMKEPDELVEVERRRTQEAFDKAAAAVMMKVADDSV